jgi:hypothetical protein
MTHPLSNAAAKGDIEKVTVLLQQGADIRWTHKGTGRTALSEAAIQGHTEIVRLLLAHGADLHWQDRAVGFTPLGWACAQGNFETARFLLQAGSDVDRASSDFLISPLMSAVMGGHLQIAKLLLEAGANVHAQTADGRNALSMAEALSRDEWVSLLKDAGAMPPVVTEPTTLPWPDDSTTDLTQPESVLRGFILSMHRWECTAAKRRFVNEVSNDELKTIFDLYCTPKERPYGRNGSFRIPPEYDAEESLLSKNRLTPRRAELITRQGKSQSLRYETFTSLSAKPGAGTSTARRTGAWG